MHVTFLFLRRKIRICISISLSLAQSNPWRHQEVSESNVEGMCGHIVFDGKGTDNRLEQNLHCMPRIVWI